SQLDGHLFEQPEMAFAFVAEGETVTEVNFAGVEPPEDQLVQEICGADRSEFRRELQHDALINAESLHAFHLLIEGHDRSGQIKQARPRNDTAHDLLMAEMQTVEHAEGQDAGRADLRIVRITKN